MKHALTALFLLALPAAAHADIAPPPLRVETCTVRKQCGASEVGATCSANRHEPNRCSELYAGTPFSYKCRVGGATAWKEIWCAPKGTPEPNPPRTPPAPPAAPK